MCAYPSAPTPPTQTLPDANDRHANTPATMTTLFDFTCNSIEGTSTPLAKYKNQVVLVVNVASRCGFTPQYAGLEDLYKQFQDRGFVILGFPCNQFKGQEPGDAAEIESFCQANFGVTFPMFAKVEVNGPHAAPVFEYLKDAGRGILGTKKVKWNFTKFLVDRSGVLVRRFAPTTKPAKMRTAIEDLLTQHPAQGVKHESKKSNTNGSEN